MTSKKFLEKFCGKRGVLYLCRMKKGEKLYRNTKGEYLYLFNWICGGFNDVWAKNKREAYSIVMRENKKFEKDHPNHVKLRPDYDSMRRCTYSEYQAQNRLGWMLSI